MQQIVDQRQRGQIEPHQTQFLQPVETLFDTRGCRVKILFEIRQKFLDRRRANIGTGFRLARTFQESCAQHGLAVTLARHLFETPKLQRKILRARRAFLDRHDEVERIVGKLRYRPEICDEVIFAGSRVEAESPVQSFAAMRRYAQFGDIGLQAIAPAYGLIQKRLKPHLARCLQNISKGRCEINIAAAMRGFEQLAPCFADKGCLHQIIHHLEMTGNVRLKRELVQDRFAESMDGLDFKSARCFERTREQPSRCCKTSIVRSAAFQRLQTFDEFFVRQDSPF